MRISACNQNVKPSHIGVMISAMSQPDEPMTLNKPTVWATVALVVCLLASALILAGTTDWEAGVIIGFLAGVGGLATPLVFLLDRTVNVHRINAKQDQKLETIERQTNGELQARVEATVQAAVERAIARSAAAPTDVPAAPADEPTDPPGGSNGLPSD